MQIKTNLKEMVSLETLLPHAGRTDKPIHQGKYSAMVINKQLLLNENI